LRDACPQSPKPNNNAGSGSSSGTGGPRPRTLSPARGWGQAEAAGQRPMAGALTLAPWGTAKALAGRFGRGKLDGIWPLRRSPLGRYRRRGRGCVTGAAAERHLPRQGHRPGGAQPLPGRPETRSLAPGSTPGRAQGAEPAPQTPAGSGTGRASSGRAGTGRELRGWEPRGWAGTGGTVPQARTRHARPSAPSVAARGGLRTCTTRGGDGGEEPLPAKPSSSSMMV